MVLSDRLESLAKTTRKPNKCAYQMLYDSLSTEDKKALDQAWKNGVPISIIVKALRQEGHKTSGDSVRAHAKGQCRCVKES